MAMLASLCVCWWKWMDSCNILHICEDVVQKERIWCMRAVSCSLEMERMKQTTSKWCLWRKMYGIHWGIKKNAEECGNSMEMMECDWFSQEQERIQSIQNKQVLFFFVCDSKHNSIHSVFLSFFSLFCFFFSFSFGIFCLFGNFVFLCQRISKKIEHSKYFWWNYCIVPQHSIFFYILRHGKFQSDDLIID